MKQVSSFISNFKKYLPGILEIAGIIFCCAVIGHVLEYALIDNSNENGSERGPGSSWEKTVMYHFYRQEENIDNIFLGSSHVYCGVIPEELDEITKQSNYNLATPSQSYLASYYLLKEANRKNDVSHVYLDMYYWMPTEHGSYKEDMYVLTRNWEILHEMPFSWNKLAFMCDMSSKEYYPMAFFEARRGVEHLFDRGYIKDVLAAKRSDGYKNVEFHDSYKGKEGYFEKKGYYYSESEMEKGAFVFDGGGELKENPMGEDAERYLRKIIQYCQRNNIEITLYSAPMEDVQMLAVKNYDAYVKQVEAIAQEYQINYYDFNLCNLNYMDTQEEHYFMNSGHLNIYGARLFTELLGEVMLAEKEGGKLPEDLFYTSYEEKVKTLDKKIWGFQTYCGETGDTDKEYKRVCKIEPISTLGKEIEYRVYKLVSGAAEKELIQDWSVNNYYPLADGESGIMYIEVRGAGEEQVHEVQVEF